MRRYFFLITENKRNEDREGGISIDSMRRARQKKNEERQSRKRDRETGEQWTEKYVSLGYYDFEDEADYEQNVNDVAMEKLAEVDDRWLRRAGLEPDEVFDDD